jgi:adenine/guanine phosphoribosyltransferase-like PRPP-binding protein
VTRPLNPGADGWAGSWVADRFGVRFETSDPATRALVGLALRRNPRRAHLLVSTVLGKHVPADPARVLATGEALGRIVEQRLDGATAAVLGFAETATGLGHCVAAALGAPYVHSTRREIPAADQFAAFVEAHSHATGHRLLPDDAASILDADVLVLVDDELSTGATACNAIAALHALAPHARYLLAALLDVRPEPEQEELAAFAARLGVRIEAVALATARLDVPADLPADVAEVVDSPPAPARGTPGQLHWHRGLWPAAVRESGRHGMTARQAALAAAAAARVGATLHDRLPPGDVLVVGTEELMWLPTLVAAALGRCRDGVRVCSTTRSPVVVLREPGYPVRAALRFHSHDPASDGDGPRFLYNVAPGEWPTAVLVVDGAADTAALRTGLVPALQQVAARVDVVVVPTTGPLPGPLRGPAFGSYGSDEVGWLLTDLSGVALEAPTEEREEAVQSGGAHYAESLPVEYQPDAEYLRLFEAALDRSATRLALAVGLVTELLLAERGSRIVLASLARAGTPVGVLVRRWAAFAHALELPHYAVSIVRGRGIDTTALRWLAARHRDTDVAFLDGWTGKGAIVRELDAAVTQANVELGTAFDPSLAVLADPGGCVRTYGTRDDFLIPSACLNSTVSGLVSRTVRNDAVIPAGRFDGAKFYRDLAAADVSAHFLDVVSERFADVADVVAARLPAARAADRTPTWAGWQDVARISAEYGIGDLTLVKPGVGETTRVLLRRVPWAVLVRPDAGDEVAHLRLLAERRGVPVRESPDLAYRCVGLIHPRYTRGATGADGRAALAAAP